MNQIKRSKKLNQKIKKEDKMERKKILWIAIGALFLTALYLAFQAGNTSVVQEVAGQSGQAANTAYSSMVGGC